MKHINFSNSIILLSIVCISVLFSILAGIILYLLWVVFSSKVDITYYIYPIFVFACVSFTTYSQWNDGDSDIIRYYDCFRQFKESPAQLSFFQIFTKGKDIGFYIMVLLLSHVLPSDTRWFSFFMIFITTLLFLISFIYVNKSIYHKKLVLCLWIIGFIFINNFICYTNILRQFFAYSVILISIQFPKYNWKTILLFAFGILCHWSMIMLIVPYYFYGTIKSKKIQIAILLSCLLLGILGLGNILYSLSANTEDYRGEQLLGVDKTLIFVQFITITISYYIFTHLKTFPTRLTNLSIAFLSLISISYLFFMDSTVVTRLFFNWTSLSIIITPLLLYSKNLILSNEKNFLIGLCSISFATYNYISLLRGVPSKYLIFTEYGLQSSFISITETVNPF